MRYQTRKQETFEGVACIDCAMLIAHADTPEHMNETETAEYLANIEQHSGIGTGIEDTTLGTDHRPCEDCNLGEDCEADYDPFSSRQCDVCGTTLGGSRHGVTFWFNPRSTVFLGYVSLAKD